jgi:nitrogen fixation NifU-like protein
MQLDNLYQEVILDHYKHHINPSCGDEITLNLTLQGQKVSAISWDGVGCSISQASVSIMSSLMMNKDLSEAQTILDQFVALMQSKGSGSPDESVLEDAVAFAGVSQYPARIKCALLGWMAFKDASVQAQKKN